MKTKQNFVSNSSSCSFVIDMYCLSAKQMLKICNHHEIANGDAWDIDVEDSRVILHTHMDNFNMRQFLRNIGIDDEDIKYEN